MSDVSHMLHMFPLAIGCCLALDQGCCTFSQRHTFPSVTAGVHTCVPETYHTIIH